MLSFGEYVCTSEYKGILNEFLIDEKFNKNVKMYCKGHGISNIDYNDIDLMIKYCDLYMEEVYGKDYMQKEYKKYLDMGLVS